MMVSGSPPRLWTEVDPPHDRQMSQAQNRCAEDSYSGTRIVLRSRSKARLVAALIPSDPQQPRLHGSRCLLIMNAFENEAACDQETIAAQTPSS